MIETLLSGPTAWGLFVIGLVVFGFAPGILLSLVLRLLHEDDPRRSELRAELYAVPRWERPFWVCEQFEVALREGVFPKVSWYWGRHVWHRANIESGLDSHLRWPESFWVPTAEQKEWLLPGDRVKLMWSVKRYPASGERMWVEILRRDGDLLVGRLKNWPAFVHLNPDETVKFHIHDIIDFEYVNEGMDPADAIDTAREILRT